MAHHAVMTGATGFIGSAVLGELVARGCRVTALLRPESNPERLLALKGFHILHYLGLGDRNIVAKLRATPPDVFIHCGWRGVGSVERDCSYQSSENIPMVLKSVELAFQTGCRQWIGLGSQAEYGNQNFRANEDATLLPTTEYGKAKLAAGITALAHCRSLGLTGSWVRVFSTYGPGDSPSWFLPYVIRDFLAKRSPRLTLCEQMWDYLYVGDAAKALVALVDAGKGGVYNLGSGNALPLKDYVETVRRVMGVSITPSYGAVPYRADQVMHLEADITRLTAVTGWRPQTPFKDGIRSTIDFERIRYSSTR